MLIPSTITARRTRRYTSTWYIHPTTHKHDFEPMDDGGRYIFQPPQVRHQVVHFISADYTTYYRILERTQKGTNDVTDWMLWFVACLGRAIDDAETTVSAALDRARFWERIAGVPLNDRQRQVLTLLVDDFQGPLTTSRWARITHCSQDTALRDITDLVERGVLVRGAGCGRSTSYGLGGPDVIPV